MNKNNFLMALTWFFLVFAVLVAAAVICLGHAPSLEFFLAAVIGSVAFVVMADLALEILGTR